MGSSGSKLKSWMIKVKIGECGVKMISDFASHKCLGSYIFLKVVRMNLRCIYEHTSFYVEALALRKRQMICICCADSESSKFNSELHISKIKCQILSHRPVLQNHKTAISLSNMMEEVLKFLAQISFWVYFFFSYGKTTQDSILLDNCNIPYFITVNSSWVHRQVPCISAHNLYSPVPSD